MTLPDEGTLRIPAWAFAIGVALPGCSAGDAAAPSFVSRTIGDAASGASPASYVAAESVIRTSCAFVRCHGGNVRGGAGLWYGQTESIRGPLVNVPACEYDKMMRVKPGDVDHSWLIVKLTAPQDPQTHTIEFTPDPDWVPNPACGLDPSGASGRFGIRMPFTGMFQLDADSLAKLVTWIAAGAPGPD